MRDFQSPEVFSNKDSFHASPPPLFRRQNKKRGLGEKVFYIVKKKKNKISSKENGKEVFFF